MHNSAHISGNSGNSAKQPSKPRPGLYHVVLEPAADGEDFHAYKPSHGVILQYKSSFGYFTLPGPSRAAVAFLVDTYADGTALLEFPQSSLAALRATFSTEHTQRLAKPYWPKRSRYERERDAFWSEVAKRRAVGEETRSMFGATKVCEPPIVAEFRPAVSRLSPQPVVEVAIVEVYRPGIGWVPVGRR